MENDKVKYLIDMINNMDIKNKLRLAKWEYSWKNQFLTILHNYGIIQLDKCQVHLSGWFSYSSNQDLRRIFQWERILQSLLQGSSSA